VNVHTGTAASAASAASQNDIITRTLWEADWRTMW
jgi:hypothetical protein